MSENVPSVQGNVTQGHITENSNDVNRQNHDDFQFVTIPNDQGDSTQDHFDSIENSDDSGLQNDNYLENGGAIENIHDAAQDPLTDHPVNQEESCKKPPSIQVVIADSSVNQEESCKKPSFIQDILSESCKKPSLIQVVIAFVLLLNFMIAVSALCLVIQEKDKVNEVKDEIQIAEITLLRQENDNLFKTVKSNFSNVQVQYDLLSQKIDGNFAIQQASYDKTNENLNLLQETSNQQLDEVDENFKALQQDVSLFQGENDNKFKTVNLSIQENYNSLFQRILDLQAKLQIDDVQTSQQIDDDKNSGWTWRVRGWKSFMMVLGLPYLTMLLIKI